jgi:hypothetical protein
MFHTQSLRQQRIAWWTVGLVIAVALATLSIAFVAFDGLSLGVPSTRQGVAAPVESGYEGSVTGPYGLDPSKAFTK